MRPNGLTLLCSRPLDVNREVKPDGYMTAAWTNDVSLDSYAVLAPRAFNALARGLTPFSKSWITLAS